MSDRFYLKEWDDYRMALYDSRDAEEPLAIDCGEPEDNTFNRDWWWVVAKLNELNDEIEALKKK